MKAKFLFSALGLFLCLYVSAQRGVQNIGLADITVIEMAGNGDIWAGSSNDGVAFFDNAMQTWSYFNTSNTPEYTSNKIYDIELCQIGGVQHAFVGTQTGLVYAQSTLWSAESSTVGSKVWGIRYRPDSVWVASALGITSLDSAKTFRNNTASPFTPITCVQGPASCAGVWVGTGNNGLFYTENGTTFNFIDTSIANQKLVNNQVNAIAVHPNCVEKFIGTNGGLSKCPTAGIPCQNFTKANSALKQDTITAVAIDCFGKVWLATKDSGIMIFANNTFSSISQTDGLPDNRVNTISFNLQTCEAFVGMKDGNIAVVDSAQNVVRILSGIGSMNQLGYELHAFPLPANSVLNFVSEKEISNGELILFDAWGTMVHRTLVSHTYRWRDDVSSLQNGIYFYSLISDGKTLKRGKIEVLR